MSTTVQKVVAAFGVVFLLASVLGFLTTSGAGMHTGKPLGEFPKMLGLFPINMAHNMVHGLFGVLGLAASRSVSGSITYAKVGGIVYIVLACLAFVSDTTFGFIPIGGNDIWLHAVLGIALAALGFTAKPTMASAPAAA
jgi:amino acid transporter